MAPQDGLVRPAADYFYYQQVAPVGDSAGCGCGCVQGCLDVDAENYDASANFDDGELNAETWLSRGSEHAAAPLLLTGGRATATDATSGWPA